MQSVTNVLRFRLGMTRMPESSDLLFQTGNGNGFVAEPVAIWKARKYIIECSDEALSLTRVAGFVKINPNYFSEKFKEVTGLNFVDYVARIRVAKAMEFLRDHDRRISEIAFAVGFQSLSQFNRVFKRIGGRSPTEFRLAHDGHSATERRPPHNGNGTTRRFGRS